MLSWFRDNAKIFLVAIIVIFVVMIFVDWGSGRNRAVSPETMAIASVNGNQILPGVYDAARNEVYTSLQTQMERSGNPYPENELALLYSDINQAAFDLMVERALQQEFMDRLGWKPIHPGLADQLVLAQIRLAGIPDPDAYFQQFRSDPNYGSAAYQLLAQADRSRFSSAMSLFQMNSRAEALFMAQDMYTQVQARYIPFRATPELPGDSALAVFYQEHPDLFQLPARAALRYATVLISPSPEDEAFALNLVDSLAMAGGGTPDTLSVTRVQMLENLGWNLDLAPGTLSSPFKGRSLQNPSSPVTACHSVELLRLYPGPDPSGALDTLLIVHWELPAYPGMNTIREALWRLQDLQVSMLETPNPFVAEDLPIVDWGEITVTRDTPLTASLTRSMISFALDTLWADSAGPVFYNPSFQGGYPALTVAERLSYSPGGALSLEEAGENGMLLLEAYTDLQEAAALEAAGQALARCESTGCDLAMLAESDSLELYSTELFSPMSVRMWSGSGEASYRGLLGCEDFADAALLAPEYTVIGPFAGGGVAYLAEITGRSAPDLESQQGMLASVYISLEQGRGQEFDSRFLQMIRDRSQVEDLREQFFAAVDSIRAARGDQDYY
jgi:hypothetical protein